MLESQCIQNTKVSNKVKIGAPVGNKNASKAKPWSDAIRKAAMRVIATDEGNRKKLDILAERLLTKALEGDVPALKELGDRIEGKVPLTTNDEGGLTIILSYQRTRELPPQFIDGEP
jgi:hypothetical protein